MKLTYLGTATILLEIGGVRLLTDPAFDPAGTEYDFGPWYTPRSWFFSQKTYETPLAGAALGNIDAVLVSHDQHADNLDLAGRRLLKQPGIGRVITTPKGAARLAKPAPVRADRPEGETRPLEGLGLDGRVSGLAWRESTSVGPLRITATPARHGPIGTPKIHEVAGWLIEPTDAREPVVWISGDTVIFPELLRWIDELKARGRKLDVAVLHCGAVCFPKLPILGKKLFTFDASQAVEVCRLLEPGLVVPIHRDGWAHFREDAQRLRSTLTTAAMGDRTRWLELGESLTTPA